MTFEVSASGFNTQTQKGFVLAVAQEAVLNITLQVGSTAQTVTVTEAAPLVETTNATLGGVVTPEKIEDLPLNGRNYLDLMLFQPGVSHGSYHRLPFPPFNGTDYVSNGATPRSNNFMLDGAILTNSGGADSASVTGTSLGLDGIQEFKVITNLFSAEYPLTMGSQTVMVSRGGTNQIHGSLFYFNRNSALDAENFFDITKSALTRNQFGGSLGGPIKKNKTFIFGTFEGVKQNQGIPEGAAEHDIPEAGCRGPAGTVITNVECPQLGPVPSVTISKYTADYLALVPLPNVKVGQGINPANRPDEWRYIHVRSLTDNVGVLRPGARGPHLLGEGFLLWSLHRGQRAPTYARQFSGLARQRSRGGHNM